MAYFHHYQTSNHQFSHSLFLRVQATWNTDQDKIKITQLVHMSHTSKILKTVGTQPYLVYSLHRPEETSMRSRPIILVLGNSNYPRGSNKYSGQLTLSIYSTHVQNWKISLHRLTEKSLLRLLIIYCLFYVNYFSRFR